MKILLTSVGRRSYLVNYFKDAVGNDGEIHVSNSSSNTPAFNYADKNVVTPLIYDQEYIPFLLDYCKKNRIDAIISLFDIDLPILSANREAFDSIGTYLVVSEESVINICNDKFQMSEFFKSNNFDSPKTYKTLESAKKSINSNEINYPVIVKPRWGMGSIGIYEANNQKELEILYNKVLNEIDNSYLKFESSNTKYESVLIQEKINGQEYGLDIINDLNGNYQNTIVKKKHAMRSGETDSAETVYSDTLKNLGKELSETLGHKANLDVDVFVKKGKVYILEINARFGGGYPFSHEAGVNLPLAIIKWLKGKNVNKEVLFEQLNVFSHKDIFITQLKNNRHDYNELNISEVNSQKETYEILSLFNEVFQPSISERINDFQSYSKKLYDNGYIYKAEDYQNKYIGFIAFYANNVTEKIAYLTFIATTSNARNKNVGSKMLERCKEISKQEGMNYLKLEVQKSNNKAVNFYYKFGFRYSEDASEDSIYMIVDL